MFKDASFMYFYALDDDFRMKLNQNLKIGTSCADELALASTKPVQSELALVSSPRRV
jgi:hypothetical protein